MKKSLPRLERKDIKSDDCQYCECGTRQCYCTDFKLHDRVVILPGYRVSGLIGEIVSESIMWSRFVPILFRLAIENVHDQYYFRADEIEHIKEPKS